MARGDASPLAHEAPFAWRIAVPWIAGHLPFLSVESGFWVVSIVGLAGAALCVRWVTLGFGLSRASALAVALAFLSLPFASGYLLFDSAMTDGPAMALLFLAVGATLYRRPRLLVFATLAGIVVRESAIM